MTSELPEIPGYHRHSVVVPNKWMNQPGVILEAVNKLRLLVDFFIEPNEVKRMSMTLNMEVMGKLIKLVGQKVQFESRGTIDALLGAGFLRPEPVDLGMEK